MRATFTIHGRPRSKKNKPQLYVRGGKPRTRPSKEYDKWAASAAVQLRFQWAYMKLKTITGPVSATLMVHQGKGQAIDVDNAECGPFDVMQEVGIIKNDYQIWRSLTERHSDDRANPRIEIVLEWGE